VRSGQVAELEPHVHLLTPVTLKSHILNEPLTGPLSCADDLSTSALEIVSPLRSTDISPEDNDLNDLSSRLIATNPGANLDGSAVSSRAGLDPRSELSSI
jgi:hypothetical protein